MYLTYKGVKWWVQEWNFGWRDKPARVVMTVFNQIRCNQHLYGSLYDSSCPDCVSSNKTTIYSNDLKLLKCNVCDQNYLKFTSNESGNEYVAMSCDHHSVLWFVYDKNRSTYPAIAYNTKEEAEQYISGMLQRGYDKETLTVYCGEKYKFDVKLEAKVTIKK
jgi:ribosomal protein S27E